LSAIAGVIRFDGAPPATGCVERITAAMAHRGPDGIAHWRDERAAMGHCMMRTTPESLAESQPLANEDRSVVLVLDGRVDNRAELAGALRARGAALRDASDAELVLRAYETWGEECADRVVGEAAFVLWDARRRRLYGARDVAGTRHFYYHAGDGWFAFASEIKGLLALGIEPRLNESRLVENLVLEFDREDEVGTCYAGIDRLPAGHWMCVDERGLRARRYWDPSSLAEASYHSMEECAEAYLEQLRVAVGCRVRHVGRVGAALSGGMDSSSIVGLVREEFRGGFAQPLATFTLVHADRENCPEWRAAKRMAEGGWLEATAIGPEIAAEAWPRYVTAMRDLDEPFSLVNGYTDLVICEAARARGCRVLLDGMAGDLLFYWFDQSLSFRPRHLRHLPGLVAACLRHRLPGVGRMLLMRSLAAAAPESAKRIYRSMRAPYLPADARLLHRRLALDLVAKRRGGKPRPGDDRLEHARLYIGGLLPLAHEGYGQIAFAHGIEPRSPFSDRRMIEFAIRLPREAKLCNGWYKLLARKGMAGILPEEVRWRRDLTMHPGGEFRSRFAAELARRAPDVWNPHVIGDRMNRWVDRESLCRAWREFESDPDPLMAWPLLTLAANAQWLGSRDRARLATEA
jgi:asparagine synthase (glutamine-hydrolysing)